MIVSTILKERDMVVFSSMIEGMKEDLEFKDKEKESFESLLSSGTEKVTLTLKIAVSTHRNLSRLAKRLQGTRSGVATKILQCGLADVVEELEREGLLKRENGGGVKASK